MSWFVQKRCKTNTRIVVVLYMDDAAAVGLIAKL